MPHQLRHIIAVNIRNPKDGLPSGRVAKLDLRGGVLAVGINGVGKTTFLRLLPLFYGATPQQILRGTGLSSMIGHTLPDASSAVAFEYERETANDLRCVVMHCRSGEDSPQFHIIHGGYREEFFYDENNQFVLREEFKARVEALGYQVSRKLFLHQYRSVILNERLLTKDGDEMRRLAAVHSLGPKPLHNLDQIAAAMANEKISFRDLRTIVIDRVSDTQIDGTAATSSRELKRNREDVSHWLEDRDHLAKIMAAKPEAEKIHARVGCIKGLHLELCTLHIAVKEALGQTEIELAELDAKEVTLKQEFEEREGEINDLHQIAAEEKGVATDAWSVVRAEVAATESRLAHFKEIGIENLGVEQTLEDSMKAEKIAKESERDSLNMAVGGIATDAARRKLNIEAAAKPELERIGGGLLEAAAENNARSESLRVAESDAIEAQILPIRIQEINAERNVIISRLGELNILKGNPLASLETLEKRRIAVENVNRLDDETRRNAKAAKAASDESGRACGAADSALDRMKQMELKHAQAAEHFAEAKAQLSPPPGSLFAFLRSTETSLWADGAKIIDPALLRRTDLSPAFVESAEELAGGSMASSRIAVGGLTLDVQALVTPSWIDMNDVRDQIAASQGHLEGLTTALQELQSESQRLVKEMTQAKAKSGTAIASESLTETALGNAKLALSRMDKLIDQEKDDAKRKAMTETAEKTARVGVLNSEESSIASGMNATKIRIREDFKQQRNGLIDEVRATELRLGKEKIDVLERIQREQGQVDDDVARALAGLGVDPTRLATLETGISDLAGRLEKIARFRHEVADWNRFRRDTLPSLASKRESNVQLKDRCDQIETRLQRLSADLAALKLRVAQDAHTIENGRIVNRQEMAHLKELLRLGLNVFLGYVPEGLHVDWNVPDLKNKVDKAKFDLATESDALQRDSRTLRNIMTMRSGPVEHWLQLKERDLPDVQTLLEHQWRCEQAQALCDWFNPVEHVPYVDQLHKEMNGFLAVASNFVRDLELFERRVEGFNRDLQKALAETERFERFRDLSVTVRSGVGQMGHMKLLRHMQDVHNGKSSTYRSFMTQERDIPSENEAALIRSFRDILPADGVLRVNLSDQVLLECSLIEAGKRRTISNEEEFRAVSSNGNTALITAMFLMGFVQMIRGTHSPVRLTWVTDEIGRFDANNLGAFLHTLDAHKIDVISASPSVDPALARFFSRLCIFEGTGAIATSETQSEGEAYVEA